MHILYLHKIDDNTFRARNDVYDSGHLPIDKMHLLASAYSGFQGNLSLRSDNEQLASRFTQLVQRYNSKEYREVPQPIINHLINMQQVDRYNFCGNGGTGKGHSVIFLGAGPTLERDLQKALDSGHFILAGGSAITYLARNGVKPDAALALDPNEAEIARFEDIPADWTDVPLIYKGRLHPDALNKWPGKKVWVPGTGWKGAGEWEGTSEAFPGGSVGVSTWTLELARYLNFDEIYFVGVDLGYSKDGTLYSPCMADLEDKDNKRYHEFRTASLIDEKITLAEIIKKNGQTVKTLSTAIDGVEQIDEIEPAKSKWKLSKSTFSRSYWRRVRRLASQMVDSIESLEKKQNTTIEELQGLAVCKYLLQPQIHIAANQGYVLQQIDLSVFMDTCKEVKPLLQRIALK